MNQKEKREICLDRAGVGKQLLEERGRQAHVKSKPAIPRIMENASGRGGEALRAPRAEKTAAQKRLCITEREKEKRLRCEVGEATDMSGEAGANSDMRKAGRTA